MATSVNPKTGLPADYVPGFICHLGTCNIQEWGYVHYQPSMIGNVLFLIIIDLLGAAHLILGPYHHTGLVAISMILGLSCESSGYIARILLHYDPFNRAYFLWYLISLTIGPVFIAAAVYLCLGRIVVAYGAKISRIEPRSYTVFFMGCDAIALSVQTVGGGIAASAPITNKPLLNLGTRILVAGLAFQVASLFVFSICSLEFLWRVRQYKDLRNPDFLELTESRRFKWFIRTLLLATGTLFVRTVFRSVELSQGFGGELANSQVEFMVLDGCMVIISCACMTFMHPGYAFQKRWNDAKFRFFKEKSGAEPEGILESELSVGSQSAGEKAEPTVSRHEKDSS